MVKLYNRVISIIVGFTHYLKELGEKTMKKAISFLLSLVLLFSCLSGVTFPVSAAADTEQASKEKK